MALTVIIRNIQKGVKSAIPNRVQVINFLNEILFPEDNLQFNQPKGKIEEKNKPS